MLSLPKKEKWGKKRKGKRNLVFGCCVWAKKLIRHFFYLRDIWVCRVPVCTRLVFSFVILHITWEHIHLNLFNIHDPLTSLSKRARAFDSNLRNLINNALIISAIDLIQKCFQFIHHFYNQRWLHYFTVFYLNKAPWAENIKLFPLNAPCNQFNLFLN